VVRYEKRNFRTSTQKPRGLVNYFYGNKGRRTQTSFIKLGVTQEDDSPVWIIHEIALIEKQAIFPRLRRLNGTKAALSLRFIQCIIAS
jgi:hypothetical protein